MTSSQAEGQKIKGIKLPKKSWSGELKNLDDWMTGAPE